MKILGVCASPRKGKTTYHAMNVCLEAAAKLPGVETVLLELGGKQINGCLVCGKCGKELTCSQKDDFPELIPTLSDPEVGGIILGSPVYFGNMTAQAKAFLDRAVMFRRNGFLWADKVGGALAVGGVRNGGQEITIQTIHAAMLVQGMIVVSEDKPLAHFGGTCWSAGKDNLDEDAFGLSTAAALGKRVAEVALKLAG